MLLAKERWPISMVVGNGMGSGAFRAAKFEACVTQNLQAFSIRCCSPWFYVSRGGVPLCTARVRIFGDVK
ncbi:hypothetical protein Trydic_g6533 [Trypoxylus dichotomus]